MATNLKEEFFWYFRERQALALLRWVLILSLYTKHIDQCIRPQRKYQAVMQGEGNFLWVSKWCLGKGICHFGSYPSNHMKSNNKVRTSEIKVSRELRNANTWQGRKFYWSTQTFFWGGVENKGASDSPGSQVRLCSIILIHTNTILFTSYIQHKPQYQPSIPQPHRTGSWQLTTERNFFSSIDSLYRWLWEGTIVKIKRSVWDSGFHKMNLRSIDPS